MTEDPAREKRLRRVAREQGFTLMKSRRRDRRAPDYGLYWLVDDDGLVTPEAGISLDDVERWLA